MKLLVHSLKTAKREASASLVFDKISTGEYFNNSIKVVEGKEENT